MTALNLVAEAAIDVLAFYEGLDIRPKLPYNLKRGQIQRHLGTSLSRQLDCSLKEVLPACICTPSPHPAIAVTVGTSLLVMCSTTCLLCLS